MKKRSPIRPPLNKAKRTAKQSGGPPEDGVASEPAAERKWHARPTPTDSEADRSQSGNDNPAAAAGAPGEHTDKLHKILAQAGLGSRRDMEAAIVAGRVSVNGKPAGIGARVAAADRILFDGRPVAKAKPHELPRILVYHKPEAEIVSRDDPEGRDSVFDKLPPVKGGKWVAVGRLDFNTSGLLIFTTSGELANRLSHPSFEVEREYAVRVMGELGHEQSELLCNGIALDDGPAKFEWLRDEGGEGSNRWYRVMLREGRNREVRRMFEAIDMMVSRLMRVRYGIINLPPRLKRGEMLELETKQVKQVVEWAGIAAPSAQREEIKLPARPAGNARREAGIPSRHHARQPARRRTRG